jgi:hypothetical protein
LPLRCQDRKCSGSARTIPARLRGKACCNKRFQMVRAKKGPGLT